MVEVNIGPAVIRKHYEYAKECLWEWIVCRSRILGCLDSLRIKLHTNKHVGENENQEENTDSWDIFDRHYKNLKELLETFPVVREPDHSHQSQDTKSSDSTTSFSKSYIKFLKTYYLHEIVLVIIMSTALKRMTKASNQLNLSLR